MAEEMKERYVNDGLDEDIITDTIVNTGLLLIDKNEYYPVRGCAIKSILDRAGIQGNGLRRLEKNVYARILNDLLKVANGEALIRFSEGKVSAVLSGDCNDYAVLDVEQIFLHSVDYLTAIFLVPDPDPCVLRPQPVTQGRRAIPAAVIDKQQFPVGKALPENTVHTAL